jgi:hypothetical protein
MEYTYKLMQDNLGVVRSDGAIIPADNTNTDYQEYLKWTKASPMNVALPADEAD